MKNHILDRQSLGNEKGIVLVMALLIMLVLTILSMAAIMYTNINSKIARNYTLYQQLFYENEGATEILPGLLRRTIALQTETQTVLNSMFIRDKDLNNISDQDDLVFTFPDNDPSLAGENEFIAVIRGDVGANYLLRVNINNIQTDLRLTRGETFNIPGFELGGGSDGNMAGTAVNYISKAVRIGTNNTYSDITTTYECVQRINGSCL